MPETNKLLTGLRCCLSAADDNKCCSSCPYFNDCAGDIPHGMHRDALEVLQSYQPRLLRLDEIHRKMTAWIEFRNKPKWLECICDATLTQRIVLAIGGSSAGYAKCFITEDDISIGLNDCDYNVTWRAWTCEPAKEQMDDEPWKEKED